MEINLSMLTKDQLKKFIVELEKENRKLKEEIKIDDSFEEKLDNENKKLREENKKLKSDLAYERTMLDNVKAEYESLQNIIKKLEEEIEKLRTDNIYEEGLYE